MKIIAIFKKNHTLNLISFRYFSTDTAKHHNQGSLYKIGFIWAYISKGEEANTTGKWQMW